MNTETSVSKIPVRIESVSPGRRLHWQRRAAQWGFLLLLVLIPVSGLLRIDPIAGAFVVLDRQIWWSDFFLVFGLWVVLAGSLVMVYSTVGTAFCGWACPQNSLAEWANGVTRRFLGKRAEVSLDGERMKVAGKKNRPLNWLILALALVLPAMFYALIPLLYFYPPDVVWSFMIFRDDPRLAPSLHFIFLIFALVFLLDGAFLRHFWCRFMCVYKIWQHGFKTRQTLHIAWDKSRAEECSKCNACVVSCFIDIDPRQTDVFDTCINCGECITACNNVQARKGRPGLLKFEIGSGDKDVQHDRRSSLGALSERMKWTLPLTMIGVMMFIWGLVSYQPYHLAAYRADLEKSDHIQDYRIAVSSKRYQLTSMSVSVEGLPDGSYTLSQQEVSFDKAGRIDLNLHIRPILEPGIYGVLVRATSADGWSDSFRIQHFVARDRTPATTL